MPIILNIAFYHTRGQCACFPSPNPRIQRTHSELKIGLCNIDSVQRCLPFLQREIWESAWLYLWTYPKSVDFICFCWWYPVKNSISPLSLYLYKKYPIQWSDFVRNFCAFSILNHFGLLLTSFYYGAKKQLEKEVSNTYRTEEVGTLLFTFLCWVMRIPTMFSTFYSTLFEKLKVPAEATWKQIRVLPMK